MRFIAWLDRRLLRLCLTLIGGWLACSLLAAVVAGCAPIDDTDSPPATVNRTCGETGSCEGSATTEHPGCDVPGVAVFDLDGRPICDGGG